MVTLLFGFFSLLNMGCNTQEAPEVKVGYAVVQKVSISGNEESYTFSVTLKSPDKGCSQYANWWEVITEDKELVYRRILAHSHVSEQPFTRSGGSVKIKSTDIVIVRGHMNTIGYGDGEIAMIGSVKDGFEPYDLPKGFGVAFKNQDPLPTGCAF